MSGVLTATGLGFLRTDAILLPVILIAMAIALWGFWKGRSIHRSVGPFALGLIGSIALVTGVVILHRIVAKTFIGGGAVALLAATVWNVRLAGHCDALVPLVRGDQSDAAPPQRL